MDRKLRVLVVDDEQDILETLDYSLAVRGFEVATETDGLAALERAKASPPDVMLLDVMLPGCNGYEVSRLLKEWMDRERSASRFPIMLLTARKVDSPEREKFIATWSRAERTLYKPFDIDEVVGEIERLAGTVPAGVPVA
jgi:two-component system, OmpR family, phosphate regulon response regulator PhoB